MALIASGECFIVADFFEATSSLREEEKDVFWRLLRVVSVLVGMVIAQTGCNYLLNGAGP